MSAREPAWRVGYGLAISMSSIADCAQVTRSSAHLMSLPFEEATLMDAEQRCLSKQF
jgi:hypothetical protein